MPRLFPRPWEGLHPAYPKHPEPLPANPCIDKVPVCGSIGGLIWGAGRSLVGRPAPGSTVRATAVCTVVGTVMAIIQEMRARKDAYSCLKNEGIKPRPRVLFEYTENRTTEDYMVVGAGLGLLVALRRRSLSGVRGWHRFVGAASFGATAGFFVFLSRYTERVEAAWELRRVTEARAATLRTNSPYMSSAFPEVFRSAPSVNTPENQLHNDPSNTLLTAFGVLDAAQLNSALSPAPNGDSLLYGQQLVIELQQGIVQDVPGIAPFLFTIFDNDIEWTPQVDYHWTPQTTEHGIRLLRTIIADLTHRSIVYAAELHYLNKYITEREHQLYKEADPSSKIIQRKILEWLNSHHSDFTAKVSAYAWMISEAKKRIRQLETPNEQVEWQPSMIGPMQAGDRRSHKLEKTLQQLRRHKENLQGVIGFLESSVIADEGSDESSDDYTQDLRELKQNRVATELLISDIEALERRLDAKYDGDDAGGGDAQA